LIFLVRAGLADGGMRRGEERRRFFGMGI